MPSLKTTSHSDMEEIWKPIPGYDGLYDASSLGRIRSNYKRPIPTAMDRPRIYCPHIIKPRPACGRKRKDLIVNLSKDGKKKTFNVSKLVALAFHGVPQDGMTVNHINCNWNDNRPENLEWITMKDNIEYARSNGIFPGNVVSVTLQNIKAEQFCFASEVQACQFLHRNPKYMNNILRKGRKKVTDTDGNEYIIVSLGGDSYHNFGRC